MFGKKRNYDIPQVPDPADAIGLSAGTADIESVLVICRVLFVDFVSLLQG